MNAVPNWQPLSQLPLLSALVRETLTDDEAQLSRLLDVRTTPWVLDDKMVRQMIRVYAEKLEILSVFHEQLVRWKQEELSLSERAQLSQFESDMTRLPGVVKQVLELSHEFKSKTIEQMLGKSDLEAGMDFLSAVKS